VKNYLRTTFDKLGVWTRLELALYVAGHGGASWQAQFGRAGGAQAPAWEGAEAGAGVALREENAKAAAAAASSMSTP